MFKITVASKALIGPRDQIIRYGSRHFGHYLKGRMIATFLIGPFTVEVCCDWFVRSLTTSGYATDNMNHSDYQGQDERQKGMLELMVIDTSIAMSRVVSLVNSMIRKPPFWSLR